MVELARVRTARPRLQLLAVEGVAVEVAVDDDVGVSALAWWRRTAVDGVADGGRRCFAAGGEVVLAPMEYEWGIGWGAANGEPCFGLGRACFWLFE